MLVVGNNWDGTADVVDPHALKVVTRLNIVPDLRERTAEIAADPLALGFFTGVNLLIGEGHNQYVDDADHARARAADAVGRAPARAALSEDTRLRVAVQRAQRGRWRDVRLVTATRLAGDTTIGLGRLRRPGRYRLAVTAADPTGNRSARRLVRFRISR